jgi:hypothetical protein
MERLTHPLAVVEQALRSAAASTGVGQAAAHSSWLQAVRDQLPRLLEALTVEHTGTDDHGLAATSHRLSIERDRLLQRLHQLTAALTECAAHPGAGADPEHLRRTLLRLVHDIAHHHQRVNDLVFDSAWRDVGGSE